VGGGIPVTVGEVVSEGPVWLVQFVFLLFLIGIPALIVWSLVNRGRSSAPRDTPLPDPEQILKVRLARGEIDTEEYQRLLGMIREDRARNAY
jgi:uncharacterized membrane protein